MNLPTLLIDLESSRHDLQALPPLPDPPKPPLGLLPSCLLKKCRKKRSHHRTKLQPTTIPLRRKKLQDLLHQLLPALTCPHMSHVTPIRTYRNKPFHQYSSCRLKKKCSPLSAPQGLTLLLPQLPLHLPSRQDPLVLAQWHRLAISTMWTHTPAPTQPMPTMWLLVRARSKAGSCWRRLHRSWRPCLSMPMTKTLMPADGLEILLCAVRLRYGSLVARVHTC